MEIILIGILILINGWLVLAEMALVSSKKVRLESAAKKGSQKAKTALELSEHPNKFLPTVQIGITVIGILNGIFSGENLTEYVESWASQFEVFKPFAHSIGVGIVVVTITFLTIIFGELLPKRIGMTYPETIAKGIGLPMKVLSQFTHPFGWILVKTTDFFIFLFGMKKSDESKVTEEEIKAIIQEGKEGGEVQEIEQDIVERVFLLGDRRVSTLMTPRSQVVMLEGNQSMKEVLDIVTNELHSLYPVYEKDKDNVIGVVRLKDLFSNIKKDSVNVKSLVSEANFILEKTSAFQALEKFKESHVHYGIIIDEYGQMQGIITLNDLLESMVGYASDFYNDDYSLVEREDGTWLIDGHYPFHDFLHYFDLEQIDSEVNFDTFGGLILNEMGRIPHQGDKLEWNNFLFEIIDMDGTRIDKVMVSKIQD
ncbi:MAG: HlyC/CorC family transporter [Saprospiraceae bacterium]|jgi:putative hemolysin|nr:HlyC/CorC family transporter [Saprospiraceae bacterium]